MSKAPDLAGQKFGRLTVLSPRGSNALGCSLWLCRCDCGEARTVLAASLRHGHTVSCGCLRREMAAVLALARATHGQSRRGRHSVEYRAWAGAVKRCSNHNHAQWRDYGGRGIKVCERWRGEDGFANFFADMGLKPSADLSLDRRDNDGNYEPGNCRWATRVEQNRNQRDSKNKELERA